MLLMAGKVEIFLFCISFTYGLSVSGYGNAHDESFTENGFIENLSSGYCSENPCLNDGTCRNGLFGYICLCKPPFSGPRCEDDWCHPNPCQNGGRCSAATGGYQCTCKSQFFGINCEKDACTGNPCKNGGTCVQTGFSFKCKCRFPYTGDICQEAEICRNNPCYNGGTCEAEGDSYKCRCRSPYSGVNCERTPCSGDPCLNGGTCKNSLFGYICVCNPPFYGPTCEEDWCNPNPCQNGGQCSSKTSGLKCYCKSPFFGEHCEMTTEDPCASYECLNGGACYIVGESPICLCKTGYNGSHCEESRDETSTATQPIKVETTSETPRDNATEDPCASFYCHNGGSCYIMEESPKCLCLSGYSDPHCEEKIDPCISMPCQNEGICIQEGSTFLCYCKPPYLGDFCEKDPCTKNPCQNGGKCVQTNYSFKCHCRHPYSGDTCQYDACYDNPCFNGGTCTKDGDFFQCKCRYGYYGSVCEKEGYESTPGTTTEFENTSISTVEDKGNFTVENYTEPTHELTKFTLDFNLTTIKPGICAGDTDCLNGGICRNSYCECPPNFGGYRCERNFICEKLKPTCRAMGATCRIVGLNAICDCPQDKMYEPKSGMCEDICDAWKCIHGRCEIDGRTYKCICDTGYTGHQCGETVQAKVDKSYVMFSIMTSLMVLICLLLIGQMFFFYRNRKFKLHTNDVVLPKCTSSRETSSDA